ncbi:nuclear pore complex protein Nup98-96 isoform X1 [Megalopta genalis]|uniref:nuclear pore complex protein Nup98-96 isoform X1 n=1 Tax=Megalopta genalis TaxID=115081 RepID=UPI001443778F|nr:nuclear pore complex protein Nup98-Nup96 isoform X1 [Megalopta genalis]XP_033343034.1 nuclear pore complex protein Nup98-Nup96 isoform X1 [Megalopta genalis]XP_033343035.1 nuclear pore complex protein Nup98-Nup96 isoform X1 [Megalopta genalis]
MFGQTGNTSFSGFNTAQQTSPFGQSAFGKPIATTSFGSGTTPVFGSGNTSLFSSKPAGSTAGGLFGNTTTPPAFTQPSFGGFGTTNTNTNLFGNQQNASTSLFGATTGTSAFGQSNKPGGFSFGASTGTNLFGQPQQTTQQTTPFGQTNSTGNTNLFGSTPGFGSTNTTNTGVIGTVVKFTPVITTDSMSKNGISHSISARHCCIVAMKEYESKSYEELRFEDYSVGRKGPSTGLFGTPAQPSPFVNAGAGTSTATTGFGGMSGGFGTTTQSGSSGPFGKPMTSFGTPSTTTTNSFAFNSTANTNLFGSNNQAKPFGTAAPTPLFATSNTNQTAGTGFGGINTAQNTGFGPTFGSTQPNQSIGLFNQNKSAFNVPSTSSSTAFTSFGQTPSGNTGSTLFGTKSTGTTGFGSASTFGATTATTFGATTGFTAGQNSGTSLFNTCFKPAGQTSGFSFGSTSAPSTGLGANTGLTLGSGSTLFGQQKPGGLFGNTGSNATFNPSSSFGSSTFGTNSNVGTGMGMGLLGAGVSNNQTKSSGTVPVHQQILALVSAPFGDSPLLKNLLPASGKTEELLKPANTPSKIANGIQYKVTADNKSPKIKAKVVTPAQLSKKSMFEGLEEEDPLSEAFQPRPNAKRLVLRPKSMSNSIVSSPIEVVGKNSQSVEKGESTMNGLDNSVNNRSIEAIDKENHSQDNNRQIANDRRSSTSWLKTSLPRNSTTKQLEEESFDGQRSPYSALNTTPEEAINNTVTELRPYAAHNSSKQIHAEMNNSVDTSIKNSSTADQTGTEITAQNTDSSQELNDSSFWALQTPNAAKVILKRAGYYTIPPLDKLEDYVRGETCVVPNFTVGREGYGNVYFPDSFDIYGLNLDEIVHFRHKEVIIYPDDEKKPPVGQGLNRKAQVTLDRVWPHDKSLHKPITDPHRLAAMDYEEKLRRVSAKHDTRFLEYRPETGSWVFKVEHFSKYGLSDSDEDDSNNAPSTNDPKRLKLSAMSQQKASNKLVQSNRQPENRVIGNGVNGVTYDSKMYEGKSPSRISFYGKSSINDHDRKKQSPVSPTGDNARILGTDSHKLQLMKASFFDGSDNEMNEVYEQDLTRTLLLPGQKNSVARCYFDTIESVDEEHRRKMTYSPILRSNMTVHHTPAIVYDEPPILSKTDTKSKSSMDVVATKSSIYGKSFPDPIVMPVTAILKWHSEVIPLSKSIINKLQSRSVADAGIQMGRMFRPSWGRGLTLLTLSTRGQADDVPLHSSFEYIGSYVNGRRPEDTTSVTIVQRIQILGDGNGVEEDRIESFERSIEGHLKIQLSHRIMDQEGDCPIFEVDTDINKASMALHAHCSLAEEFVEQFSADSSAAYVANVWQLCVALWGTLPDVNVLTANPADHNIVVARREAIGEWLKSVIQRSLETEITKTSNEKRILDLLSASELQGACEIAREAGDHCLALLMAQLRSGMPTKALIKQQIALWQDSGVDENISTDRLKLFALVAGEPLVSSKHGLINVCEDLDWKRALAVHLWYFSSPVASIRDTLELYESAFDTSKATYAYAAAPIPEYKGASDYEFEVNNGQTIYDLCYHLLKLFCIGNHTLGELLNPAAHTADPLDYRLSWLMQQVLLALGYSHLSEHVAALTHINFATQLEAYGLWHWAIFVMLHLKDAGKRKEAVKNLLQRHTEIDNIPDYIEREKFLREELGIPSVWIHEAKAVKSYVAKRYGEAASYFIEAEQWNTAHEIIIEHLAADAIINENYEYLRDLLSPLIPPECSSAISGWSYQGDLLWEYMEITMDIESLLRGADPHEITYKLELLRPRLTCLCLKINQFPCPTAKHRLCQAEIAKRTLHLARSLLQANENKSTVILQLVLQLPLPEDYAQQELRPIVNMRVNEIISQAV